MCVRLCRREYGKMVGLYLGPKRTVILNDYDLINEAFFRDDFVGRPAFLAGFDLLQGAPET